MSRKYSTKKDMMAERFVPKWAREIIVEVANKYGIKPNVILLDFRQDTACQARWEAIYRIKEQKPSLSASQIGRWFDRDHTSVLYALARHAARVGVPPLSTYSIQHRVSAAGVASPPKKGVLHEAGRMQ